MALRQLGLQVASVGGQLTVVVLGGAVAAVQWGAVKSLVGWALSLALLSIVRSLRSWTDHSGRPRPPTPRLLWSSATGQGTTAALLLCSIALVRYAPAGLELIAITVVVLAAIPPAWWDSRLARLPARRPQRRRPVRPPQDVDAMHLSVASVAQGVDDALLPVLTSEELCRAWRGSYVVLRRARSATELALAVDSRRRYLDEMERRWSSPISTWLHSGARAASGPDRFLRGPGPHPRAEPPPVPPAATAQ